MMRTGKFLTTGFSAWMCWHCSLLAVPVTTLVFSPDGTTLISNADRAIEVRSAHDAKVQRRIECSLAKITSLVFSPDAKWLVVAGGEPGIRGEAMLYSWPDGTLRQRFGDHADLIASVAIDAVGQQLLTGSVDHSAKLWLLKTGFPPKEKKVLKGHSGPVLAAAFSPRSDSVVTASADRSLKVWSAADGKLQRSLSQHTEAVQALSFRPDDGVPAMCASAGNDRTVRLWQPEIGRMVRLIRKHDGPVLALAWSQDGQRLFSAGQEGLIRCIDGTSDTIQHEWRSGTDWVYSLAVSPDGVALAAGDWTGGVIVHALKSKLKTSPKRHEKPVQ